MSKYCKECERLTPDHAEDCPLYPDPAEYIFYWECSDCTGYNQECSTCEGAGFLDAEGPVDPSTIEKDTGRVAVEINPDGTMESYEEFWSE